MKLLSRHSVLTLAAVSAFCLPMLLSRGAVAADSAAGEKLLPPETLLYFSIPSVEEYKAVWGKSSMGRMLADKSLQPFIEDVKNKITETSEKVAESVGLSIEDLMAIPDGEMTFALVNKPAKRVAITLLMGYGDNEEKINQLLGKLDDKAGEMGAKLSKETVSGVEVQVIDLPKGDPNNPFKQVVYFTADQKLVFSTEMAAAKAILERWSGTGESFADNAHHKYIQSKCLVGTGQPIAEFFVNPMGLTRAAITAMEAQVPQAKMALGFFPLLGLDKLQAIGGTAQYGVGDFGTVANSFICVDQPVSGLMNLFQMPAIAQSPPKWVDAESPAYSCINWDAQTAFEAVKELIEQFQGPGALDQIIDQLAEQEEGPKVHIKNDIIDQLNGRIHVVGVPGEADPANPLANSVFAIELKDAEKMRDLLANTSQADGVEWKSREFEGNTLYEVETDGPNNQSVSVVATVYDSHLFIASGSESVESILRGNRAPLSNAAAYKALAKFFPKKASSISFQRPEVQMKALYEMLKNAPAEQFEGIDFEKLPPFEEIAKYFSPSGSYIVPDAKGAFMSNFDLPNNE